MSDYIWINQDGESCCGKRASHGGMTLMAHVRARAWQPLPDDPDGAVELSTERGDHWIGWPAGTKHTVFGQTQTVSCEYCPGS